jgi:hypothetical protein
MAFLLVWDKDSYTGRFLVLFSCIYVLQPQLVYPYQSSPLIPNLLSMVALASLSFYIHSCTENTSTTFKFLFLSLSCSSYVWPSLSVTCDL